MFIYRAVLFISYEVDIGINCRGLWSITILEALDLHTRKPAGPSGRTVLFL